MPKGITSATDPGQRSKSVFSRIKSKIGKKKKKEAAFDFSKYGVRAEDSFRGTSMTRINIFADRAQARVFKGAFVLTNNLKEEGAKEISVTKGCLKAKNIFLSAFESILIDGSLSGLYKTTLRALTSITLKGPEVHLIGMNMNGEIGGRPSLTIISNSVNIVKSDLSVDRITIATLDPGTKSNLLISKSEISFSSLAVKMSKMNFTETTFTHQVLTRTGEPELKGRRLSVRSASSQNLPKDFSYQNTIHFEGDSFFSRRIVIKAKDTNFKPSLVIKSNLLKMFDSQVDVGNTSLTDDNKTENSLCSIMQSNEIESSRFLVKTLQLRYRVLGILNATLSFEELSSDSISIKRVNLVDIQGTETNSTLAAFASKIEEIISERAYTLLVDDNHYEIEEYQRVKALTQTPKKVNQYRKQMKTEEVQ